MNSDKWGSVTDKVIISVDENKYRISEDSTTSDGWENYRLVYDTAEAMNDHTFYIRDIQTGGAISNSITETFGIDGTKPTVNEFNFKVKGNPARKLIYYLTFGIFCNDEVDVTVTASDTGFASGVDTISLFYNDAPYGTPKNVNGNMATFTLTVEEFATLKTLSARATDKVGNMSEMTYVTCGEEGNSNINQACNGKLQLEQNKPQIEVAYENASSIDNSNNKWYGKDIDFSVKVADAGEQNSGIRAVWATINGAAVEIADFTDNNNDAITPYSDNANGVVSGKDAYYFIDKKTEVVNFKINTDLVDVPAKPNGKYEVEIFAVDNAGTQVKYDEEIIVNIDRDEPVIIGFEFKSESSVEGNEKPVATVESYGYFFTQATDVVVTAKDFKPSAGVKQIEFYTIDKDGVRKDYEAATAFTDTSDENTKIVSATFSIPKGFKGQIYARAIDKVGHTAVNDDNTPKFFNPNGAAIEDAKIHKSHSKATVTLVNKTAYSDNNGLPLYKWTKSSDGKPDGIPVKLYVKDTFSGISSITWKVTAPYNATEEDPAGTTTVGIYLDSTVAVGDVIDGWKVEAVDKNLVTEMSKVIYITNNSNDIKVDLSFNDRALNRSAADTLHFSIDNTVPEIDVVYDNNTPDSEYTDIYNKERVATVKIKERNFNAKDIVFKITNTDGTIPNIDLTKATVWIETENSENPDENVNVAEIKYTADGDYTFDISYKDNAENKAAAFKQHKFTIDRTLPTVSLSYDNNTAANGKYFAKARTATVVVKEHNFDVDRVDFSGMSAMLNGNMLTKQPTVEWKHKGDIHTAKIVFSADADYTFDVMVTDKASNESKTADIGDSVAAKAFVVDQTIDIPLSIMRSYKKPIELGDCYYIKDNEFRKIKTALN